MVTIENQYLKVDINETGGEATTLVSKKTGESYLHDGKSHWKYSAPVLFPFIGNHKNNQYQAEGRTYALSRHGFARNMAFTPCAHESTSASLVLKSSAETLCLYPYEFMLTAKHSLIDNTLLTTYTVENTDVKPLYFALGAHPALKCPFDGTGGFSDYYLEFDVPETTGTFLLTKEGLFQREKIPFFDGSTNILPLNYALFDNDALVFSNLASKKVKLKSKLNSGNYVAFDFGNFPYLGIWTVAGAPFLCIEPWQGHADYEDFSGDISQKEGIVHLNPKEKYQLTYEIAVYEQ